MRSFIIVAILIIALCKSAFAQDYMAVVDSVDGNWRDSLQHELLIVKTDTMRALFYADLCNYYKFDRPDSAFKYGYKALALSQDIDFPRGEVTALIFLRVTHGVMGNISKDMQLGLEVDKLVDTHRFPYEKALNHTLTGSLYEINGELEKALRINKQALRLYDSLFDKQFSAIIRAKIGYTYVLMNEPDSAVYYVHQAYERAKQINVNWVTNFTLLYLGKVFAQLGQTEQALSYYKQAIPFSNTAYYLFDSYFSISEIYLTQSKQDSSLYYANESLKVATRSSSYMNIIKSYQLLSRIYENRSLPQALEYSRLASAYKDSLASIANNSVSEALADFDARERQREMEFAEAEYQKKLRQNIFLGSTFTLLVIAGGLFYYSRQKQKSKRKIEVAYERLKNTQSQLIQSEKMASLGELTAGIAHEIQNPLNFVNNFSEVNSELIKEIQDIRQKTQDRNSEEDELLKDIADNLEKINNHGKRADGIVKSMLQHSRSSSGKKELTDINALCDEYLRLAYHGYRAKDKNFNAKFETDFDATLPKLNIVPQDIGRVVLNLINNAFYAVTLRQAQGDIGYEPTVTVATKKQGNKIEISVKDNGPGIPENIKEKIFQPFFTTKPTGQGTGLGLYLAYDIVTKGHGGTIEAISNHENGCTFLLNLTIA